MNAFNSNSQMARLVISHAGCGALLVDASRGTFDAMCQRHVWAVARRLACDSDSGVIEVVPGVNNLLVIFDANRWSPSQIEILIRNRWTSTDSDSISSCTVEIPTLYGGEAAEDLPWLARESDLTVEEYVLMHSNAIYEVACIGSMPGFAYLTGLPTELAKPRRASPRGRLAKGTVIIGGTQAGVMPCTAPSGWHAIGHTELDLFDAYRESPCLLSPGDKVRFVVKDIIK